jgi:hypothetical protein
MEFDPQYEYIDSKNGINLDLDPGTIGKDNINYFNGLIFRSFEKMDDPKDLFVKLRKDIFVFSASERLYHDGYFTVVKPIGIYKDALVVDLLNWRK